MPCLSYIQYGMPYLNNGRNPFTKYGHEDGFFASPVLFFVINFCMDSQSPEGK